MLRKSVRFVKMVVEMISLFKAVFTFTFTIYFIYGLCYVCKTKIKWVNIYVVFLKYGYITLPEK